MFNNSLYFIVAFIAENDDIEALGRLFGHYFMYPCDERTSSVTNGNAERLSLFEKLIDIPAYAVGTDNNACIFEFFYLLG